MRSSLTCVQYLDELSREVEVMKEIEEEKKQFSRRVWQEGEEGSGNELDDTIGKRDEATGWDPGRSVRHDGRR